MKLVAFALLLVLVAGVAGTAAAGDDPPPRALIEGVPPMPGPDPLVKALGRAIRIAADPTLTDDYLYGVSGAAFLATVCANNCTCRDYRDLVNPLKPAMAALGVRLESFEGGDDALWARIRASIAAGIPVAAWNPFGDMDESLITGYDVEKDLVYGRSTAPGEEYAEGSLSKWREGGLFGFLVGKGLAEGVDRKAVERAQLAHVVRMARRAPLEGG